jgi:SAM-dependent methyltransferase
VKVELLSRRYGAAVAEDGYLLASGDAVSRRLRALSAIFDPWTFAHLEALGIGPGWGVWEVGAGAGSVAAWLAAQVGPLGTVVATDIDPSVAAALTGTGVDVRRHDVATEAAPGEDFDLVHARLVLVHVSEREAALASMVGSIRSGGWLVVEDADPALQPLSSLVESGPEDELANRIRAGFRTLLSGRGAELAYGRTLPGALAQHGLVDVAAEGYLALRHPAAIDLEIATVTMLRRQLVDGGLATDAEIERHLEAVASGRLDLAQPPLVTAWGRRA